jgi:hypothetical protein
VCNAFLEGLAQQVLAALGIGDVAVDGQHQVVRDQRVGGGKEAEVALDDLALVVGQTVAGPSTARCPRSC